MIFTKFFILKKILIDLLVEVAEHDVQVLKSRVQLAFVGPHVELLHEFRNDEEGAPTADLFRLEDVAEDVVSAVKDVLALGADQVSENLARSCFQGFLFPY